MSNRKLNLQPLEARAVPAVFPLSAASVLITPDDGGIPRITAVNSVTGEDDGDILAYEPSFRGGVNIARGDVNGDGVDDLVIAPGSGGGPRIRILNGQTGAQLADFFVYEPSFRGGVTVAVADVNGDNKGDIVTGTGSGGGPRVRILDGATLGQTVLNDYFAYKDTFRGGVLVAAGDVNGDGKADVVTGTGVGGGPRVTAFLGFSKSVIEDFFAFESSFRGGVTVAVGDLNGDSKAEIITGAGPGGGAVLRVFNPITDDLVTSILADDSNFRGGIRVNCDDLDGDGHNDIVSRTRHGNEVIVRVFDSAGAFVRSVGRQVDDSPSGDDSAAPRGGGTLVPGTTSALEGTITAIDASVGTIDLRLANGTTVVVQAGPGTKIERNDLHTTLATFVVGERGEAVIGPEGIAWEIEAKSAGFRDDDPPGGDENGIVIGKVEGIITAVDAAAGRVSIRRSNGVTSIVTAAPGAKIERNDVTVPLSAFLVNDRGEALIGSNGLAFKIEAYPTAPGGGSGGGSSGGNVVGQIPGANVQIQGTITAINLATNRLTIRTTGGTDYLVQIVSGTKVERNNIQTTLSAFRIGDFGEAKYNASALAYKVEAVGA